MAPRQRLIAYGLAGALIVAGGIAAIVLGGTTRVIVASTLATLGLGGIVLLVFYEIGLSEDRELAKEEAERRRAAPTPTPDHPRLTIRRRGGQPPPPDAPRRR
jgi:hypothetical protein